MSNEPPLSVVNDPSLAFDYCDIAEEHVAKLKRLNSVIFPIQYNDNMYEHCLASGPVTQLAFDHDTGELVGAIACRLELRRGAGPIAAARHVSHMPFEPADLPSTRIALDLDDKLRSSSHATASPSTPPPFSLPTGASCYIMTLGVLAPFRNQRIGSRLLMRAIASCREDPEIRDIYLHVQTSNDEAVRFYSRFGFHIAGTVRKYYRRIDPPDAFLLYKSLIDESSSVQL